MSTKTLRILAATTGIVGVIALMISFSINPAPPAGATTPAQIIAWGEAHKNLVLAGAWLQAFGSFLNIVFILAMGYLTGVMQKLTGWLLAFSALLIMGVSMVEVSFYISAVQSGVSGDINSLMTSLMLIKAIQHAYVIVPAPALLFALSIAYLNSPVLPRVFGYIGLGFAVVMGILGLVGTFLPLQDIIDYVLAAQEVWFLASAIALFFVKAQSERAKSTQASDLVATVAQS